MDIGNLSNYSDIYKATSNPSATRLEGSLKGDYSKASDEELMDACKKFESYFLEQVFKGMQKTIPRNEEKSGNALTELFEDQYIQQIAENSTEQNSLGLAQMLFEQMKRNYGLDPSVVSEIEK